MSEAPPEPTRARARTSTRQGVVLAGLGVVTFSFSFPATEAALDGFGAWSVTGLRGVLAAVIAGTALLLRPAPLPRRDELGGLVVVAVGCALGFPLLTTLALTATTTAHSAVVVAALPVTTALLAAIRSGAWQPPGFWWACGTGAAVVVAFSLAPSGGAPQSGDLLLLGALMLCAAGYAEGGRLAPRLGGWRVIAWGVLLAAPVNAVVTAIALVHEPVRPSGIALLGLAYVAALSQFGGFVALYAGMARIGVARASQLQLAQPLLTLVWAASLLGESVPPTLVATALVVLACIVAAQRAGRR